jgi:hypothetical protein
LNFPSFSFDFGDRSPSKPFSFTFPKLAALAIAEPDKSQSSYLQIFLEYAFLEIKHFSLLYDGGLEPVVR